MAMTVVRFAGLLGLLSVLSACASGPMSSDEIYDPFEETNRQIHEFNKSLDEAMLQPTAKAFGETIPEPVRDAIHNSANNLKLPGQAVNHVLQGEIPNAFQTIGRFAINSTIGIFGLFDPASQNGIFEIPTNFGETLGQYGVDEGPYIELPLLGGTTLRGVVGMGVDFAIDPMRHIIPSPEREYLFILSGLDLIGDRYTYLDLVNVLLYESSDSYASQRLAYLQNLRHNVTGETSVEDLEDPFAFDY